MMSTDVKLLDYFLDCKVSTLACKDLSVGEAHRYMMMNSDSWFMALHP